jgi:hypothetical protein
MAAGHLTAQVRESAVTRRLASSSVAHVPFGYARSLRPGDARLSRLANVICSEGGR